MECGDMNCLSGVRQGRAPSSNGIYRNLTNSLATPRSQSGSNSHQASPRVVFQSRGGTGGTGGGYGLGGEEFGGQIPPWEVRETERPLSPCTRQSRRVGRQLMMASRDKESLLEEIIQLKKAVMEQSNLIRLKNVQSNRVGCRNRKLEMDVDDLEMSLQLEGPRTGSPHRLRAKLQGLQMTVEELQEICESQREELLQLRRDIRTTHTREVEVERDVFAGEVRRLQKVLTRMHHLQNRISCENRDLSRLKNKYKRLEMANLRLENCMTGKPTRPQSQPGVSRKVSEYDNERYPMRCQTPRN